MNALLICPDIVVTVVTVAKSMTNSGSLKIDFNTGAQMLSPKIKINEKKSEATILEVMHEFIILLAFI
ncbi:MAG: hypothetical protein QSU88_08400, partial [Candidatus Methanoperedens sp.]|nr:hypothetical protein [Candidatus Methanoperedens sp.]